MAFKDLLLQLTSYPEPTAPGIVEAAAAIAADLDARLTALAFEIEIPPPMGFYADAILDISGLLAAEREKSVRHVRALATAFETAAGARGVPHAMLVEPANTARTPALVRDQARLRDLTILGLSPSPDFRNVVAETVVFESGRPVLILPEVGVVNSAFERIVLAWDFGRPAARALADALPFLQRAGQVQVVSVATGTPPETTTRIEDLVRHLEAHGVSAGVETIEAGDRTVGAALADHADGSGADLLVMGAFGHSRLRDFVIGGATRSMLAAPPLPIFLSH